jgi:AcrR family transcriptional regulator
MAADAAPAISPRREATRQRLLDAAARVFAETGLDAASVEAICERAGYTRGAFYSNFDSKDELFLALCAQQAQAQIDAVGERVARFAAEDAPGGPSEIVHKVLEVVGEDREGVLLLSEIRLHALRTPSLASAYLAQEAVLEEGVARIVADVARVKGLRLRVDAAVAGRILLATWITASARAVMGGLEAEALRDALGRALAEAAALVLEH